MAFFKTTRYNLPDLKTFKKQFGPLRRFTIHAKSIVAAHEVLGKNMRAEIARVIKSKVATKTPKQFASEILFIRSCAEHFSHRVAKSSAPLSAMGKTYISCLTAWAKGSGISTSLIPARYREKVPSLTALDLAWWLQNDNVGCQTGMMRETDGGVIFWHTEEDNSGYLNKPYVASFKIPGFPPIHAFMYPFLLPGPAFAWNTEFFQAVDFLYVGLKKRTAGTLANSIAWMSLWYGQKVALQKIVAAFGPYFDGYAVNTIKKSKNQKISGDKIEFGADAFFTTTLKTTPGSKLVQANCVSSATSTLFKKYNDSTAKKDWKLRQRVQRVNDWLMSFKKTYHRLPRAADLTSLLASRNGKGYGFANTDVKAYVFGRVGKSNIDVNVDAGPCIIS